ncbi:MAG: metallophosphoesterase family protein [Vicinamibacteria bacterium]
MISPRPPRRRDAAALGNRLFRFAVVADTHVNEQDGASSSPFRTNALANDRARFVFADINRLEPLPEFVVHLGDVVHPVPELPTHADAVARFKAISAGLRIPLHVLSGNHDVGDKVIDWMPAGTVVTEHVELYRRFYGPDYYTFDAKGCRFMALNAQIINSGLPCEREQKQWVESQLGELRGGRWFLCMHYPPYVTDRDEPSTYDNIDEPGRAWLIALIERYKPEALFCGHVHHFWYDVLGGTEMYLLPATSFLRHDYTEFYRVEPGPEHGRNDAAKFGYFVVDVHEGGHVAHCIRTFGATLAAADTTPASVRDRRLEPVHTKTNRSAPVGVDLRHPWAELVEIAATGGVQEFERKKARNDYPLLALWEMGVRRLRVPLQDFLDPRVRHRMRLLREIGHEFHAYCFDVPAGPAFGALESDGGLVDSLEIVLPWSRMREALRATRALRAATGVRVHLSKLRKHEDARFDGSRFSHFINHGFVMAETFQITELLAADPRREGFDGLVFRVPRHEAPVRAIKSIHCHSRETDRNAVVHVRLAAEDPAVAMNEDLANACRVAETVFAGLAHPEIAVYLDTFMDVDRGYFPRTGFIDRRYNPRPASRVYAALHAALADSAVAYVAEERSESLTILFGRTRDSELALVLPTSPQLLSLGRWAGISTSTSHSIEIVDLAAGVSKDTPVMAGEPDSSRPPGSVAIEISGPTLVRIAR